MHRGRLLSHSQGVTAKDIAAKNGMNAGEICEFCLHFVDQCSLLTGKESARVLRLLATHHVFREVEPDVWTNNRLSSMLDTMKPTSELFSK
jgi:hypothetical protein